MHILWIFACLQNIESRLKVLLPDDVGAALMDGVVLCHLANHICPRSVASIHVPSPAVVSNLKVSGKPQHCDHKYMHFFCEMFLLLPSNVIYILFFQPKLSMAKCRRNVENFLDACKKMGVPQVIIIICNNIDCACY